MDDAPPAFVTYNEFVTKRNAAILVECQVVDPQVEAGASEAGGRIVLELNRPVVSQSGDWADDHVEYLSLRGMRYRKR